MKRSINILYISVLVCVFGVNLCYAETIWEKRQKALSGEVSSETTAPITDTADYTIPDESTEDEVMEPELVVETTEPIEASPFNITVPSQYGSVIESNKGTNGKLIIHIQDAHANYEAQKNEANIIESLINSHGIKLILQEGGSKDANFKYLRTWAPIEERKEKADKLLREAVITGEEYLTIASNYPMDFQGIEDENLHDAQTNAMWEIDTFKDVALEYVNKISEVAQKVKEKLYNQDLLSLDKARKDYENEKIDLLAYYKTLNDSVQKKTINIDEFTYFKNLIKINELEKKIDFLKINSATATDEQKNLYKEYQDSLKNLNVNKLFKEELPLESKILSAISENQDQKELIKISKALSISEKMLKIKLVPEEYEYFLNNKKDFDPNLWAVFLKKKSDELTMNLEIPSNSYAISDNMPKLEKFFGIAEKRDNVFLNKTEEAMAKDDVKVAVLIAGGFHTPKLTQLFNEKGYSYVVISPRVTTPTDDALYRAALKR